MKKNNPPVFTLTIVAMIVGVALFKQIDFNTFTVEKKALSAIYFVTFAASVLFWQSIILVNRRNNDRKLSFRFR
jgi:hypothetical protein